MITALFLTVIIGIVAVLSEILAKEGILNIEISRKLLHFTASSAAAISVLLIDDQLTLLGFGIFSVIVGSFLVKFNLLNTKENSDSKSLGIVFLPIAFTILVFLFYPDFKEIVFLSMLLLGIADATAAIFGTILSSSFFYLTRDRKSFVGSITFFFSSFTIVILFFAGIIQLNMLPEIFFSLADILLFALSISILLTVIEAISSTGFDNFTIPIFTAILFYIFATTEDITLVNQFSFGVFLSALVALASIKFKFLTLNGSAATFILASFIFGLGGIKWSLPIMTFFIFSSIISKIRLKENDKVELFFEKSGVRDYLQVLSNGGIGGVMVLYNQIYPNDVNYYIYLASLAAVCADTWATEIGTIRSRPTYNILNLKKIEQGTSGGISLIGTVGAALGSVVIAFSGIWWVDLYFLHYLILIVGVGLFGSFFDSVLGATIQVQSKCEVCKRITEKEVHCGESTKHHHGIKWFNNDAVNFFSGTASALLILLILYIN